MGVTRLSPRPVERIWGRTRLPDPFAGLAREGAPLGEIWFETGGPEEPELLVKYLFTAQRLSVQVHPNDKRARASGHARGKDEAWLVLAAEPGAVIGLGPRRAVTRDELRQAAVGGGIDALIDWKPVKAGEFFYSPAGTIHAIGGGLALIEVQQNCDTTYRLHDYGRARELHLDQAVPACTLHPWTPLYAPREIAEGRKLLATGGCFTVERWRGAASLCFETSKPGLVLIPVGGAGMAGAAPLRPGTVVSAGGSGQIRPQGEIDLLVAYPGPVQLNLVRREHMPRRAAPIRRAGNRPPA